MASSSFAFTNAAIAKFGDFATFNPWVGNNAHYPASTTKGTLIEFTATGTDCSIAYNTNDASSLIVTIDGGTPSTPTLTADLTWQSLTLFTGLSDSAHTVSIYINTSNYPKFNTASFVTVTGAAPAISYTSTTGTIYPIRGSDAAAFRCDDCTSTTFAGNAVQQASSRGSVITFRGVGITSFKVFGFAGGSGDLSQRLAIDNDQSGTSPVVYTADGTQWKRLTTFSGLSGTHDYRICFGSGVNVWGVEVFGGTIDTAVTWATRNKLVGYGDSKTASDFTPDTNDVSNGWLNLLGCLLDMAVVNKGNSGTTVHTFGRDNTSQVTGLTYSDGDRIVIFGYGRNDASSGVSQANFEASCDTMLDNIIAGVSGTIPIDYFGIIADGGVNTTLRNTFNGYIQNVITGIANSRITYRSADAWTVSTDAGGVHPDDAGDAEIADQMYAIYGVPTTPTAVVNTAGQIVLTFPEAVDVTDLGDLQTDLIIFDGQLVTAYSGSGTDTLTLTVSPPIFASDADPSIAYTGAVGALSYTGDSSPVDSFSEVIADNGSGLGKVAGSSTLALTDSLTLTGQGAVAGSSALALTTTGTLTGKGAVAGSSAMSLSAVWAIGEPELVEFAGSAAMALSATCTLGGTGAIAGSSSMALTARWRIGVRALRISGLRFGTALGATISNN